MGKVMIKGKHLIAGEWVSGDTSFESSPATGAPKVFWNGTTELVDQAVRAAEDAFGSFGSMPRAERAAFIERIAVEIEARGDDLTEIAMSESGLPKMRLEGERGRTVAQLRMFADHIVQGDYLDRRHVEALPDREPMPRPDLFLVMRPMGPVAVFGASNFPLAFSTAGGDTASALAAGCPVVVKGHPAHPGTGDLVAQAIDAAIKACGVHPGTFSFIQDSGLEVAQHLVRHPLITAVGFTGSLSGGRALYDICAAREIPIPFYGELGSINPVFVLDTALARRGDQIAQGWAGSLTLGAGQFCTNPGVLIVAEGEAGDKFVATAVTALQAIDPQVMLTDGIANAFKAGVSGLQDSAPVTRIFGEVCNDRAASPVVFSTSGEDWLSHPELAEEIFGPAGIIVRAADADEMTAIAKSLGGQLTATVQMDAEDSEFARTLVAILERKAGRIIANGFPTGVEVADPMVHGGPYPASTNFGASSVGSLSIRRFLRPVCYQDIPVELLNQDALPESG
jgi:alpha-ketoglutaric semialdehyde dehydrogenase